MKIVIADDEPAARQRMGAILHEHLGEQAQLFYAADGLEALRLIEQQQADLAFLDISMPKLTGIEVAQTLTQRLCAIIFVTAYDTYAVEAFEARALDYLVKPYSSSRLLEALARAERQPPKVPAIPALLGERFAFKVSDGYKVVAYKEISAFTSQRDYVSCYVGTKAYLLERTLEGLVGSLPEYFIRIHRSSIINVHFLSGLQKDGNAMVAVLNDHWQHHLPVSKRYRATLLALLHTAAR